jgi:hypothetical protein
MHHLMGYQFAKQRHSELLREAERNRQVKALRTTGSRRAGRSSALTWELRRHGGVLLKLLRTLSNAGHEWGRHHSPIREGVHRDAEPELTREGACDLAPIQEDERDE